MKKIGMICLMAIGMISLASCSKKFEYTPEQLTQILKYAFDEKLLCKNEINGFIFDAGSEFIKGERDGNLIVHTKGNKETQYTYEDGLVTKIVGEETTSFASSEEEFYTNYLNYFVDFEFFEYESVKTTKEDSFFYTFKIICLEETQCKVYLPVSEDSEPITLKNIIVNIRFVGKEDISNARIEVVGYDSKSTLTTINIY